MRLDVCPICLVTVNASTPACFSHDAKERRRSFGGQCSRPARAQAWWRSRRTLLQLCESLSPSAPTYLAGDICLNVTRCSASHSAQASSRGRASIAAFATSSRCLMSRWTFSSAVRACSRKASS